MLALVLNGVPGCGGKANSEERTAMPGGADSAPGGLPAALPPPARLTPPLETCENNPLLAGCPPSESPSTCPENPRACPASAPEPVRRSEDLSLPRVVRMEALLEEECGICHGAQARRRCEGTCEGMSYIDDLNALLESEKLIPCDWPASPIARRVRDGSMPPPSSGLPLMSLTAQRQLEAFVADMCAPFRELDSFRRVALQQVLLDSCADCHSLISAADAGGSLPRVDDIDALIDRGYLIPCRSQASPLVIAIQNDSMPPPGSGVPPMSAEQLSTLVSVIDSPCAR